MKRWRNSRRARSDCENAYSDLINDINVGKEQKNAAQVKFASTADEELLHLSRHTQNKLLLTAQQRLSTGDAEGAKKLAQQALDEKNEVRAGRFSFWLKSPR